MKPSPVAALALIATLSLAGCSSGDDEDAGTPEPTESTSAASEGSGIISPDDLPEVPEFEARPKGIIADVQVEDCSTGPGEVAANGTATNTGKFARDLVVVVNWAVTATSDVVARGVATLEDVEPGDSADWDVEAEFDVDEPVGCVPTALAGQLQD